MISFHNSVNSFVHSKCTLRFIDVYTCTTCRPSVTIILCCRVGKTSHSKGPSTATNSMDEGIESASAAHMPTPEITCTSSHLLPPYLKVVSSQEILNASTLDSHGYERPIEVTTSGMRFNRLRHPIRLRSHSHCTPDNNSTARLGSCLPPPTYSQIFSSSQSTTTSCTEISSPHSISPFDENCRLEGGC